MAKRHKNGAEDAVLAKLWIFWPKGQPKFFPDNHIWVAGCPKDNQQIFLMSSPGLGTSPDEAQNIDFFKSVQLKSKQ